jgi:hypothetical protein
VIKILAEGFVYYFRNIRGIITVTKEDARYVWGRRGQALSEDKREGRGRCF